jgi:hypothetical protein
MDVVHGFNYGELALQLLLLLREVTLLNVEIAALSACTRT